MPLTKLKKIFYLPNVFYQHPHQHPTFELRKDISHLLSHHQKMLSILDIHQLIHLFEGNHINKSSLHQHAVKDKIY